MQKPLLCLAYLRNRAKEIYLKIQTDSVIDERESFVINQNYYNFSPMIKQVKLGVHVKNGKQEAVACRQKTANMQALDSYVRL